MKYQNKKDLQPYWNEDHTKYAILVATKSFLGWSVMNVPEVAWDSRIVGYVIEHMKDENWQKAFNDISPTYKQKPLQEIYKTKEYQDFDKFLNSIKYFDMYLIPIKGVEVVWVDAGRKWRIRDGGECQDVLEFEDEVQWISFKRRKIW